MQKRLVFVLLIAIALVAIIGVGISLAGDSAYVGFAPYVTGHLDTGHTTIGKCVNCHSRRGGSDAHATHARRLLLNFSDAATSAVGVAPVAGTNKYDGCGRCHSEGVAVDSISGDLSSVNYASGNVIGSDKKIRKQVSSAICQRCHGGFISTGTQHTLSSVSLNSNCLVGSNCHVADGSGLGKSAGEGHSAVPGGILATWVNGTIVNNTNTWQYCTLCHGQNGTTPGSRNFVWFETNETNLDTWPSTTTTGYTP